MAQAKGNLTHGETQMRIRDVALRESGTHQVCSGAHAPFSKRKNTLIQKIQQKNTC